MSAKEQRNAKLALAAQALPRARDAFLSKTVGRTDPEALLLGAFASGGDVEALAADMHLVAYANGVSEKDFGSMLFAPTLRDIRTLPAAILDAKEELPPSALLPQNLHDLRKFIYGLMLRSGSPAAVDFICAGWSRDRSPQAAFTAHVDALWDIRKLRRPVYDALVGGRFATVIRFLRQQELDPQLFAKVRHLLIVQALIWCAHDVQMVAARVAKRIEFGTIANTTATRPSPEGVLNQLRARRKALEAVLDVYFGSPAWRTHDVAPELPCDSDLKKHGNVLIRDLAKRFSTAAHERLAAPMTPAFELECMQRIAAALRSNGGILERTASQRTTNIGPKNFAAIYNGLDSPLAVVIAAVARLMQAELEIPDVVDRLIERLPAPVIRPVPTGLGAFRHHVRAIRSDPRFTELILFYQDEFLRDRSADGAIDGSWKAKDQAISLLIYSGVRVLSDHEGSATSQRRSFYLLDVLPEHRFAAGA